MSSIVDYGAKSGGSGGSGIVIVRYIAIMGSPVIFRTAATDAYTKLLLHADGSGASFVDSESVPKTITAVADATQSATQSKFGGKSVYFDGTGDYLSLADSADWDFPGDFTIDFWVRFNAYNDYQNILSTTSDGNASNGFWLEFGSARGFTFYNDTTQVLADSVDFTGLSTGTWYHIALVRSGTGTNNVSIYLNGVQKAQASYNGTINGGSNALMIGKYSVATALYTLNGWVDELRISKGIARWTANFTPPTSAYSSTGSQIIFRTAATDAYTKLLLHADGSGASFVDSESVPKTITAVADATQSATQSKFGGKSAYFDGTGDYLSLADSADWDFGSGDFTIDAWVRFANMNNSVWEGVFGQNVTSSGYDLGFQLYKYSDNTFEFDLYTTASTAKSVSVSTAAYSANTWYHFAVVRNGNTLSMYINGTSVGTPADVTGITAKNCTGSLFVGSEPDSGGTLHNLNGYMDELRISKGIARWTANFTPPTSAYSSTGSTVILK